MRYKVVGWLDLIFGSLGLIQQILMLFFVYPKLSTLYKDFGGRLPLNPYVSVVVALVLAAVVYVGVRLVFSKVRDEKVFLVGIVALVAILSLGGIFISSEIMSVVLPIYSLTSSPNFDSKIAKVVPTQVPTSKPYLGVEYMMISQPEPYSQQKRGANVLHIVKGSPAELAGIQTGDILTAIDSKALDPLIPDAISAVLQTKSVGQVINITLDRFICDNKRNRSAVDCTEFNEIISTVSATLVAEPSPKNSPYFSLFDQITAANPNISWAKPRPDDAWDSQNEVGLTGFSLTGEYTFSSPDFTFTSPLETLQINRLGWTKTPGGNQYMSQIASNKLQILQYWLTDRSAKSQWDPTTQKLTRTCPCAISYKIFLSFPTVYPPTPTPIIPIFPTHPI